MKSRILENAGTTILVAALLFGVAPLGAAERGRRAFWPEFHGPNRDNISTEKGLLKKWPVGGPKLIWKSSECGWGYSGVSLADGMIFTAGDFDDVEMVIALNRDGKLLWTSPNGKSWTGPHPGSRTTPTYDNGVLYHMNPTGRFAAYGARSGKEIWSVELGSEFDGRYGTWAMAENVIVDGNSVFCVPGGSKGLVVALDKKTGKTIWANTDLSEVAAYCSPILVTYKGIRQFITMTQKSVISVDVRTGKLLWSHPHVTPHDQNVTSPIFRDGYVFVASGHSAGATLLKINTDLRGVTEVWFKRDLDNCHGGVILIDGRLYGSACRIGGKGFFCADFLTGKRKHTDGTLGKISLTCADGMIYGLSHRGRMYLMEITGEGFDVVSRFDVPRENNARYLTHPVVCGGRLYLRHGNDLYVHDIRREPTP